MRRKVTREHEGGREENTVLCASDRIVVTDGSVSAFASVFVFLRAVAAH
jgi:hypothetical protein